jgi:hypothetical protein
MAPMLCQHQLGSDMKAAVKELMSQDGTRKVQIFRRDDGSFGFESWRFSDEPLEGCWIPDGRYAEHVAPTQEIAEREARSRVDWLREAGSDELRERGTFE